MRHDQRSARVNGLAPNRAYTAPCVRWTQSETENHLGLLWLASLDDQSWMDEEDDPPTTAELEHWDYCWLVWLGLILAGLLFWLGVFAGLAWLAQHIGRGI